MKRDEYDAIRRAWRAIAVVADIEEEWDSLIQNYIELETELLNSAIHSMVRSKESYDQFQEVRLSFSRRLFNLLQTCRSYLDHSPHHLKKLKIDGLADAFCAESRKAYDANFSYRFMEALRNYSQHRGVPMHSASFNSRWIEGDGEELDRLRYIAAGSVDLEKIRDDTQFKKAVLSEIDAETRFLDVATLTREYVEGLGGVHDALRKLLAEPLEEWKAHIRSSIKRYGDANDNDVRGLSVAEFESNGTVVECTNIFDELPQRVEKMFRRNGSLVNLRRRYVSSELVHPKQPRTSR